VNNYLVLDERQEEARRLAANATPKVRITFSYFLKKKINEK